MAWTLAGQWRARRHAARFLGTMTFGSSLAIPRPSELNLEPKLGNFGEDVEECLLGLGVSSIPPWRIAEGDRHL